MLKEDNFGGKAPATESNKHVKGRQCKWEDSMLERMANMYEKDDLTLLIPRGLATEDLGKVITPFTKHTLIGSIEYL